MERKRVQIVSVTDEQKEKKKNQTDKIEKYYTMPIYEMNHSKTKEKPCFSPLQEKLVRQELIEKPNKSENNIIKSICLISFSRLIGQYACLTIPAMSGITIWASKDEKILMV